MMDPDEITQLLDVDSRRARLLGAGTLRLVESVLVACRDVDPRQMAGVWASGNAECGTDAVRRASAVEPRRGDEDSLETRLRDARDKPRRANGPKPGVKATTRLQDRGDLAVVRMAYLHFPGSATSTERVLLVNRSDEWKVDTEQSRRE